MNIVKLIFLTFPALTLIGDALAQAPVDYSKVQIETVKLAPNFYVLNGQGGAIGVLTGPLSTRRIAELRKSLTA